MDNQIVGLMRLSGEEAVGFVNSLLRPTQERIDKHNNFLEKINDIEIKRSPEGFVAEVADLDLSFLDEKIECEQVNLNVMVSIRKTDNFLSIEEGALKHTTVSVEIQNEYGEIINDDCLPLAA